MIKIAPSILSADFGILAEEIAKVEAAGADQLHIDIMDGRFVPNLSMGFPILDAIRKRTRLPLDLHLMIVEPDKYLAEFADGTGVIPATLSAAALTKNYRDGGPLAIFFDYSKKQGLVRPVTPGYIVDAKVFEKVAADIAKGADVEAALDAAVDEINADIEKNKGYGH